MRYSTKIRFLYIFPVILGLLTLLNFYILYVAFNDPGMQGHPVAIATTVVIATIGIWYGIGAVGRVKKDIDEGVDQIEKIEKEFL